MFVWSSKFLASLLGGPNERHSECVLMTLRKCSHKQHSLIILILQFNDHLASYGSVTQINLLGAYFVISLVPEAEPLLDPIAYF